MPPKRETISPNSSNWASPKLGAVTTHPWILPFTIFIIILFNAGPWIPLQNNKKGFPLEEINSRTGSNSPKLVIVLLEASTKGFFSSQIPEGSVAIRWLKYPSSISNPSLTSKVVSSCWPSSTVITPSLPTWDKTSAINSPILTSLLAAIVATLIIDSSVTSILVASNSFSTVFLVLSKSNLNWCKLVISNLDSCWQRACAIIQAVVVPSPAFCCACEAKFWTNCIPKLT